MYTLDVEWEWFTIMCVLNLNSIEYYCIGVKILSGIGLSRGLSAYTS